jgi:hypothetical protein
MTAARCSRTDTSSGESFHFAPVWTSAACVDIGDGDDNLPSTAAANSNGRTSPVA